VPADSCASATTTRGSCCTTGPSAVVVGIRRLAAGVDPLLRSAAGTRSGAADPHSPHAINIAAPRGCWPEWAWRQVIAVRRRPRRNPLPDPIAQRRVRTHLAAVAPSRCWQCPVTPVSACLWFPCRPCPGGSARSCSADTSVAGACGALFEGMPTDCSARLQKPCCPARRQRGSGAPTITTLSQPALGRQRRHSWRRWPQGAIEATALEREHQAHGPAPRPSQQRIAWKPRHQPVSAGAETHRVCRAAAPKGNWAAKLWAD